MALPCFQFLLMCPRKSDENASAKKPTSKIISTHCDPVCRYFKINGASFLGESSIIHYAGPSGAKTKAEFKLA